MGEVYSDGALFVSAVDLAATLADAAFCFATGTCGAGFAVLLATTALPVARAASASLLPSAGHANAGPATKATAITKNFMVDSEVVTSR